MPECDRTPPVPTVLADQHEWNLHPEIAALFWNCGGLPKYTCSLQSTTPSSLSSYL